MTKSSSDTPDPVPVGREAANERVIEEIRQALRGLRFGSLLVVVQDGVVVQIDRTEKKRLSR